MIIAVTAAGGSLNAQVDPRFGRCPCFLVIDTESMDFEAIENPNMALGGGAGTQSGQLMAEKEVEFVLTGNCGPNAHQALSAAGIKIIVGCSGVVREVVERFKAGGLSVAGGPNVASHFGTGAAPDVAPQQPTMPGGGGGMGRGMGMGGGGGRGMGGGGGRGMGGGGGRGMGGGGGRGMGMGAGFQGVAGLGTQQPAAQNVSEENELAMLKQQAEAMAAQMQQMQERIRQMEGEGN